MIVEIALNKISQGMVNIGKTRATCYKLMNKYVHMHERELCKCLQVFMNSNSKGPLN